MTEREIKKKLYSLRDILKEEEKIILQIQRIEDRQFSITQQLTGMPHGSTPYTTLDYVVAINTCKEQLCELHYKDWIAYGEILFLISNLDPIERTALSMYYLLFMNWDDIAQDLGKSYRYVQALHKEAIKKLAKISKNAC